MRKKRFSIFDFDHEYIPFSVWNIGSEDLEEVNEDHKSEGSGEDNRNGMWSGPYRPKKGDADIRPQIWINNHPYAKPVEPILFTDKSSSSAGNFPRRDSNLLKALHRRITDKNNSISGQKKEPEINQISSTEKLGKRNGQEDVRYLDEMASIPVTGYDSGKYPETGQVQIPGKTGATPPDNFPRRDNNLLKALHQRITNKNGEVPVQKTDTVNETLRTVKGVPPGKVPESLPVSTRGYIDAPGMTLEVRDTFLKNMTPAQKDSIDKVYNQYAEDARQDLRTLTGKKIKPVKAVVFDPDTTHVGGPIQYKNDTITAKWNFLDKSENLKRSQMLHEMQHHADKNKLPFRWEKDNMGNSYIYSEDTDKINNVYMSGDDELSKLYSSEEWEKEKRKYGTLYKYQPSSTVRAEINAANAQLKAHQLGIIPLSEKDLYDLNENLKSYYDYLKLAEDYEKEKNMIHQVIR
ncbi:hypothetical protein [Coprobacter sp.]